LSATTRLIDTATRRQIFLERFAGGEAKKAVATLNRLRRDINVRIMQEPTQFQRQRLVVLLADIDAMYLVLSQKLAGQIRKAANETAISEAQFSAASYNQVSKVDFILPSNDALIAAVGSSTLSLTGSRGSVNIADIIKKLAGSSTKLVAQTITDGLALGDTTPQIARKVSESLATVQTRHVDAVVRTAINDAAEVAREQVYGRNADLVKAVRWVATLDNRTSLVCAGRDGQEYPVNIGPRPPAHFRCRSATIPVINGIFSEIGLGGDRPSKGADGEVEFIGARQTYGGWLKKQPKDFIDEALGKERSALFRSGKLSIDRFTDPTGRTYTLSELDGMTGTALI